MTINKDELISLYRRNLNAKYITVENAGDYAIEREGKGKREDELEQIGEEIHYATPQTRSATSVMIM